MEEKFDSFVSKLISERRMAEGESNSWFMKFATDGILNIGVDFPDCSLSVSDLQGFSTPPRTYPARRKVME